MYNKVDTKLDLTKVDKQVLDFWDKNNIFKKSVDMRANSKDFVFYDGPPGMNGLPHIGHSISRTFKDTFCRYKTMRGYRVERRAGWDCHGLPVEQRAEKDLGFNSKQDIEKYGVENFVNKCKEVVDYYMSQWVPATKKIGYWVDFEDRYKTSDNEYIESVWWALKQIFDKGLIYEGYKVVPYCPRCGTGLSSHEVAQGYEKVKDRTVYVKFKLQDKPDTFFIAWTTTPWTLPSNTALAVNPKVEYSLIQVENQKYIMASNLVSKLFENAMVLDKFLGKKLEYTRYEPLFEVPNDVDKTKGWFVTCADYVTTTDGTGIVHIAPAFGVDDSLVGKEYNLPFVQLIDKKGCFKETVKNYAGMRNTEANGLIIDELKNRGVVVKEEKVEHDYPHCWRCHTPLIFYASNGWFIKMSNFRQQMLKNNNDVNFVPASTKDGRMGNFLANALDWNLSRDRYWATPLNIWKCDKCGHLHSVGSREELKTLGNLKQDIELHRPYVDAVTFKCDKCGGTMHRVPQVVDVWFDSGAMPFAQLHYPFENKEKFQRQFPADFISEGQDQTRGWFYTLQAISTVLFDKTPYKNCVVNGVLLDPKGKKMSKSLGNVVNPNDLIDKYGCDIMRWYFLSNAAPLVSLSFNEEALGEIQHKMVGTLWNTYAFYVLYANIDNFKGDKNLKDCKLSKMDNWVLSKLNTLIADVTADMDSYNYISATRKIEDFVEVLSNWYVRRSRERFWIDGENADKTAAFTTLYNVLMAIVKLIAPFMPFMAESIYLNLKLDTQPQSIHLCDYSVSDKSFINKKLEKQMDEVVDIVSLGRAVRADTAIKNRQPLANMYVYTPNAHLLDDEMLDIIKDDLNVKNIQFIVDTAKYITFELKPQLKTLGPKYGKLLGGIRQYFATCNTQELVNKLNAGQIQTITIDGQVVELSKDDVLVHAISKPDYKAQSANGMTVILDTVLTEELINEGIMREVISKLQSMRKEAGYEVEDHINLYYTGDKQIINVINNYADIIKTNVVIDNMQQSAGGDNVKELEINGYKIILGIKRV